MQVLNSVVFVWTVKQIFGGNYYQAVTSNPHIQLHYVNTPPFTINHTQMIIVTACTSGMSGNKRNNTQLYTLLTNMYNTQ